MMKSAKVLLTCCAISSAVILLSSGFLIAQVKKVGVVESTVIGDISALEGVHLTSGIYSLNGNQYWNYEIPLNNPSNTVVSHELWWEPTYDNYPHYGYINLFIDQYSTFSVNGQGEVEMIEDTSPTFSKFPLEEILERSNLELNYKETIIFDDYIAEYPILVTGSIYLGEELELSDKSKKLIAEEIKIPVNFEQELDFTLHEDSRNGEYFLASGPSNFEVSNFSSINVEQEQLFFYYQTYSDEVLTYTERQSGEHFSTLESSAYFYQMDYLVNEEKEVDISNLKLMGSLPQEKKVNNIKILDDNFLILVETYPDGKTVNAENSNSLLLIYDRYDFSLKQEIPLSGNYTLFTLMEDALFLYSNTIWDRNYFTFLKKGEDGLYKIMLNHVNDIIFPEEIPHILVSFGENVYYIEDKLILLQLVYSENYYKTNQEKFVIRVYDETGILYGGIYEFDQLERISSDYNVYLNSESIVIS